MIEFNGVQGPVYLFLTHTHTEEIEKRRQSFSLNINLYPSSLRLIAVPYLLKEENKKRKN